eukprot:1157977-Pelagomonas_calceolata.AAC.11
MGWLMVCWLIPTTTPAYEHTHTHTHTHTQTRTCALPIDCCTEIARHQVAHVRTFACNADQGAAPTHTPLHAHAPGADLHCAGPVPPHLWGLHGSK